MPYNKETKVFNDLLELALKNKEIVQGVNRIDIPQSIFLPRLRESLQRKEGEIWDTAAKEIREVDDIEISLEAKRKELQKLYPAYSENASSEFDYDIYSLSQRSRFQELLTTLLAIFIGITILLAIGYCVSGFFLGWTTIFRWLASHFGLITAWIIVATPIGICLFVYLLNQLLDARRKRAIQHKRQRKRIQQEENMALQQEYEQKKRDLGIDVLETRFSEMPKSIQQAVLEKGILPELRLTIGTYLRPSYETILPTIAAPGLSEVFDPAFEISTEPKKQLRQQIESMPGGSIGIAGPRGAGKTTLLRSLELSLEQLQGRPPLSVLIPAPVEYDARDFILHIFSTMCSRLLKLERATVRTPWTALNEAQLSSVENNPGTIFFRFLGAKNLRTLAIASIIVGFVLIMGSIALIRVMPTPTTTSAPSTSVQSVGTQTPTTNGSANSSKTVNVADVVMTYSTALGISSSTLFPWGLFLVICGIASLSINKNYRKYLLKDEERRDREERQRKVIEEQREREKQQNALVSQAWGWLENIRFQQSYSSGWSGSLQLPLTLAGSVNSAVSLAQNQLSLPEIIEGYRQFIEVITSKYTVVIAIDEMDKLESDEKAERFLNEIKVLFGLPHCFYLISISESAMSSFERRGLPFRDVFDSSFDRVIFVDYLKFQHAYQLLRRRVIGLPVPFVCLCYCLSGGLPRDLIRKCRDLLEHSQATSAEKTLTNLCKHLILADTQIIIRALAVTAKKNLSIADLDQFLHTLNQLEGELAQLPFSLQTITDLLHKITQNVQSQENSIKQEQISTPETELATYLYYTTTLFEYFTEKTEAEWKATNKNTIRELEQLAKVRQYFSISLHVAWNMISHFRRERGMSSLA